MNKVIGIDSVEKVTLPECIALAKSKLRKAQQKSNADPDKLFRAWVETRMRREVIVLAEIVRLLEQIEREAGE